MNLHKLVLIKELRVVNFTTLQNHTGKSTMYTMYRYVKQLEFCCCLVLEYKLIVVIPEWQIFVLGVCVTTGYA
jgi:hypothetical protein